MKIRIRDLKSGVIMTSSESKLFSDVVNINENETVEVNELIEELEEVDISEIADSLVDSYTSDLLEWYNDDMGRVYYMTEAIAMGATDGFQVLSWGQLEYYREQLSELKDKIIVYLKDF